MRLLSTGAERRKTSKIDHPLAWKRDGLRRHVGDVGRGWRSVGYVDFKLRLSGIWEIRKFVRTADSGVVAEVLRRVVDWATKSRGLVGGQTGDYNRDRFGIDDIVLWGQSIGSGPSTKVATEKDVGGLILECALAADTSFNRRSEGKARDHKPGKMFSKLRGVR